MLIPRSSPADHPIAASGFIVGKSEMPMAAVVATES
jgi:hypothetical protein